MAKGYWIAHVHVTDPEEYRKYVSGARCYHSAEYQSARNFRAEAGIVTIVLVEGS